ncbi:conjugal transfer protein TraP [Pectobacterium atrosepticum]|uniref:conjugal transfer protein TraP n=1 Tax=Pectobacterium atrosepticum TaxID=29471 RepID=UPI003017B816
MKQQNDLPTTGVDDAGDFGEADNGEKNPFWKRDLIFGYSLPWLLGATALLVVGGGYLFGPSLPTMGNTPSDNAFSEVENTLGRANNSPTVGNSPLPAHQSSELSAQPQLPEVVHNDKIALMTDIRDELNERDSKINSTLSTLKDSVSQLSEAIKRDETYAVETRNQINTLVQRLTALETQQAVNTVSAPKLSSGKRQTESLIAGMKVMSLENGMAWIKWQGSTWAVREGDVLGKVTIRQIEPASRSVITTGGTLR